MDAGTRFKRDEIVILLGAGASIEADVPGSQQIISEIEGLIASKWSEFRDLYNYVKSSILYADGIKGYFASDRYNVELLVNTLDELKRGSDHPLFPFVGSWNARLAEVAGPNFCHVSTFRDEILRRVRDDWIPLKYDKNAEYYSGLSRFQKEFEHPLRIFTLNYDLCVEKGCSPASIERGFSSELRWDWRLFDEANADPKDIYLYKLHGSIDWKRDANGNLTYLDAHTQIEPDELAIIFAAAYKLQYVDPFLFFAYELRKWTITGARIIVVVGYSFADEHINGILGQSLRSDLGRKLLIVSPGDEAEVEECKSRVAHRLGISATSQLEWWPCGAREFMENRLKLDALSELFPETEQLFPEL